MLDEHRDVEKDEIKQLLVEDIKEKQNEIKAKQRFQNSIRFFGICASLLPIFATLFGLITFITGKNLPDFMPRIPHTVTSTHIPIGQSTNTPIIVPIACSIDSSPFFQRITLTASQVDGLVNRIPQSEKDFASLVDAALEQSVYNNRLAANVNIFAGSPTLNEANNAIIEAEGAMDSLKSYSLPFRKAVFDSFVSLDEPPTYITLQINFFQQGCLSP